MKGWRVEITCSRLHDHREELELAFEPKLHSAPFLNAPLRARVGKGSGWTESLVLCTLAGRVPGPHPSEEMLGQSGLAWEEGRRRTPLITAWVSRPHSPPISHSQCPAPSRAPPAPASVTLWLGLLSAHAGVKLKGLAS